MKFLIRSFAVLTLAAPVTSPAAELVPVGIVGNAGEAGGTLIRQMVPTATRRGMVGCGVALDRQGTLWTRMADGTISRLTLDGREVGSFPAPTGFSRSDALVAVNDRLALLAQGELSTLPLDAAPGTAFEPSGQKLHAISRTAFNGKLGAITSAGQLIWLDPATGTTEPVAEVPDGWLVEVNERGNLFVGARAEGAPDTAARLHQFAEGKEVTTDGWPKAFRYVTSGMANAGSSVLQSDGRGGFFISGSGFVSHVDGNLNPAPGTVLGRQIAFVIGGAGDWHYLLDHARGVTHLRDNLYVVCGSWGNPFFARWENPEEGMKLLSWFASLPQLSGLQINADGTIFADRLAYEWNAAPHSFPEALRGNSIKTQTVRLAPRLFARMDTWAHGSTQRALPLDSGPRMEKEDFNGGKTFDNLAWWKRATEGKNNTRVFPAVSWPDGNGYIFLSLADLDGGMALRLNSQGSFREELGFIPFHFAQPGTKLTSLTMRGDTLLAAVDGQVVELKRDGEGWKEQRRWNSWGNGPADRFGATIQIDCDGDQLLVADTDRHRVLWFDAAGGPPKAQVGVTDTPGKNLDSLSTPGLVAVCNGRGVVFDSANQRVVKMELRQAPTAAK